MSTARPSRTSSLDRRQFNQSVLAAGAASLVGSGLRAETEEHQLPAGKAKACIFLWLGGGMCHVDTFDPKRLGDPKERKTGSAYGSIPTVLPGVEVCEHRPQTAQILDRAVLLRSVSHHLTAEHAAPTNLFKTGRPTSGTIVYPSIGSIVSHELGPRDETVPAYVVMGYPNVTRGPGFLGSRYSYLYLTDTASGPQGLKRPDDVTDVRERRRRELLAQLRQRYRERNPDDERVADYDATVESALNLAGPQFRGVFDLSREPDSLRNRYGDEFGQRCLLARRLVQSGVRFVEVSFNLNFINGTGWDTHREGQVNQHKLIQGLDQSLTALIADLQKQKMFDDTLVVLATEFGRPPEFDGGGGRGHHAAAFSTVLFGGGLKLGQAIGTTDELGKKVVERKISLPDWHATIHHSLGIDPHKELFAGDRPVPITDYGKPVAEVFG